MKTLEQQIEGIVQRYSNRFGSFEREVGDEYSKNYLRRALKKLVKNNTTVTLINLHTKNDGKETSDDKVVT